MKFQRVQYHAFYLLAVFLLSSCNLLFNRPITTDQKVATHTAAASTLIAQLTQLVTTPTENPPATMITGITGTPTVWNTVAEREELTTPLPPTETPTPQETATPAETEPPTAILESGDPLIDLGKPTWEDVFKTGDQWSFYEDEFASFKIEDEKLVAIAHQTGRRNAWMLAWPVINNFYLEVTARPKNCSGMDRYGLVARASTENGIVNGAYLFGFTCDGQYAMFKWNGKRLLKIIDWTPSEFIQSGANRINRLGFMAKGSRITLYANGHVLGEVREASFKRGGFGVYIGSENTPELKVIVSNVSYWELP